MSTHVAVLMGGWSAEREVSLSSGAAWAAIGSVKSMPAPVWPIVWRR